MIATLYNEETYYSPCCLNEYFTQNILCEM